MPLILLAIDHQAKSTIVTTIVCVLRHILHDCAKDVAHFFLNLFSFLPLQHWLVVLLAFLQCPRKCLSLLEF
jgi:hypothetical protein